MLNELNRVASIFCFHHLQSTSTTAPMPPQLRSKPPRAPLHSWILASSKSSCRLCQQLVLRLGTPLGTTATGSLYRVRITPNANFPTLYQIPAMRTTMNHQPDIARRQSELPTL